MLHALAQHVSHIYLIANEDIKRRFHWETIKKQFSFPFVSRKVNSLNQIPNIIADKLHFQERRRSPILLRSPSFPELEYLFSLWSQSWEEISTFFLSLPIFPITNLPDDALKKREPIKAPSADELKDSSIICCGTKPPVSTVHRLSSTIFPCCSFVCLSVRPTSVTSPFISPMNNQAWFLQEYSDLYVKVKVTFF